MRLNAPRMIGLAMIVVGLVALGLVGSYLGYRAQGRSGLEDLNFNVAEIERLSEPAADAAERETAGSVPGDGDNPGSEVAGSAPGGADPEGREAVVATSGGGSDEREVAGSAPGDGVPDGSGVAESVPGGGQFQRSKSPQASVLKSAGLLRRRAMLAQLAPTTSSRRPMAGRWRPIRTRHPRMAR